MTTTFTTDIINTSNLYISNSFIQQINSKLVLSSNTIINNLIPNLSNNSNVGLGYNSLSSITSGSKNTAIGSNAILNLNASSASCMGSNTINNAIASSQQCVAIGSNAAFTTSISTSINYVAIGKYALNNYRDGTPVAIGANAGSNWKFGRFHLAVGADAFISNTTNRSANSGLGYNVVFSNVENSILIGCNASTNGISLFNLTAIGYNAVCSIPNTTVIGNNSTFKVSVGNGDVLVGTISGAGSPINSIVPDYIGQMYINTSGSGEGYISKGLTNVDWFKMG
jgi:hypothetical protein